MSEPTMKMSEQQSLFSFLHTMKSMNCRAISFDESGTHMHFGVNRVLLETFSPGFDDDDGTEVDGDTGG